MRQCGMLWWLGNAGTEKVGHCGFSQQTLPPLLGAPPLSFLKELAGIPSPVFLSLLCPEAL